MSKRITELNHKAAFDFLMQPDQYCTTELPEYFDFKQVLEYCSTVVKGMDMPSMPKGISGVNLDILTNKDGRYGVRPLTISNPFLYAFLVRTICEEQAWSAILECFDSFKVDNISACSIPIVPNTNRNESFHKSATILNWWSSMEQTPIELSLKYRYMFMSDITNCFGQIMPQSIDWALSRKGTALATDRNHHLAQIIIEIVEALKCGQNVGIPQGSTAYALIAELVLGYADLLLDKAVRDAKITA